MSFLQFFDFIPLSSVSKISLASAQKRCYRKLFRSITKELSEKTQVLRRQIKPFYFQNINWLPNIEGSNS